MKKIKLNLFWKFFCSLIIIVICIILIRQNNQKYISAQTYEFCYSKMNTKDYEKCYKKDDNDNYEIKNILENTKIIYDTVNTKKYFIKDDKILKENFIEEINTKEIDNKVYQMIKSTGSDFTSFDKNEKVESKNFATNEKYILKNFFPKIDEDMVSSIEYKSEKNNLTITEYNKDKSSNYVTMTLLMNEDVSSIEIPA